jgi:hypothetical protein
MNEVPKNLGEPCEVTYEVTKKEVPVTEDPK